MATIERLDPATLSDPSDYGYAQVTRFHAPGPLLFISGQLGDWPDGRRAEGFEAQLAQAFANLDAALQAGGASRETVLKITLLVVGHNEARLRLVSRARREFFGSHRPASTLIPVPRLAGDWMLFEIDVVAAVV